MPNLKSLVPSLALLLFRLQSYVCGLYLKHLVLIEFLDSLLRIDMRILEVLDISLCGRNHFRSLTGLGTHTF